MSVASRVTVVCSLSLSLLGLANGCHRHGAGARHADPEDEAHDRTLRGAKGETRSATRDIAHARCERELRCNNIGTDRKFASQSACEDQIRSDWAADLNTLECPNGVVEQQLEECLAAIRAEECNSPFDTLSRMTECQSPQICAD
jgi:hypothetical protein